MFASHSFSSTKYPAINSFIYKKKTIYLLCSKSNSNKVKRTTTNLHLHSTHKYTRSLRAPDYCAPQFAWLPYVGFQKREKLISFIVLGPVFLHRPSLNRSDIRLNLFFLFPFNGFSCAKIVIIKLE